MRSHTPTVALLVVVAACTGAPPLRPAPASFDPPPYASAAPAEAIVFEPRPDASIEDVVVPEAAAPQEEEVGQCETPVRAQRVLDSLAEPGLRQCATDKDCALANKNPGCNCGNYYGAPVVIAYNRARFLRMGIAICGCGRPSSLTYLPVCRAGVCRVLDRGYQERCLAEGTYWMPDHR